MIRFRTLWGMRIPFFHRIQVNSQAPKRTSMFISFVFFLFFVIRLSFFCFVFFSLSLLDSISKLKMSRENVTRCQKAQCFVGILSDCLFLQPLSWIVIIPSSRLLLSWETARGSGHIRAGVKRVVGRRRGKDGRFVRCAEKREENAGNNNRGKIIFFSSPALLQSFVKKKRKEAQRGLQQRNRWASLSCWMANEVENAGIPLILLIILIVRRRSKTSRAYTFTHTELHIHCLFSVCIQMYFVQFFPIASPWFQREGDDSSLFFSLSISSSSSSSLMCRRQFLFSSSTAGIYSLYIRLFHLFWCLT